MVLPDVSDLKWYLAVDGVRLRWEWPEGINTVLVLWENGREPDEPTSRTDAGGFVRWIHPEQLQLVCREDYDEEGESCFLPISLGLTLRDWHIVVRTVSGEAVSPATSASCKCRIPSRCPITLDYEVRRKSLRVILRWRVDGGCEPFGFVVVAHEREMPRSAESGIQVFPPPTAVGWPDANWRGTRKWEAVSPFGDAPFFCRLFVDVGEVKNYHVRIRHPESIFSPVSRKKTLVRRVPSSLPGRPRHILCPYCLKKFGWWEVLLRNDGGGREEPLPWWLRFLGRSNVLHAMPESILTDYMKSKRACPKYCREMRQRGRFAVGLNDALFRYYSLHLGVLGTIMAGANHWIFGTICRLESAGLSPIEDRTYERLKDMRELVIGRKARLPPTPLPPDDVVPAPLLFHASGTRDKFILGLHRTAGECWERPPGGRCTRYFGALQGFVYIVDPLQIPSVRSVLGSALPEDASKHGECCEQETPLFCLLDGLRQQDTPPYHIPIAVVVSKGDAIRDHDPMLKAALWEQPLYHQHHGTLSYDLALHWNVQFAVREFLMKHEPGLAAAVEHNFEHFAYFCVAPMGCSAQNNNRFPRFSPWRVEEPLLWIMWYYGLIQGV
jgi:hypothetical protein